MRWICVCVFVKHAWDQSCLHVHRELSCVFMFVPCFRLKSIYLCCVFCRVFNYDVFKSEGCIRKIIAHILWTLQHCSGKWWSFAPLPPIDIIWAMMIVWRTRGDYRTARAVLEAIIAFSAMHTYYEQLLQSNRFVFVSLGSLHCT